MNWLRRIYSWWHDIDPRLIVAPDRDESMFTSTDIIMKFLGPDWFASRPDAMFDLPNGTQITSAEAAVMSMALQDNDEVTGKTPDKWMGEWNA